MLRAEISSRHAVGNDTGSSMQNLALVVLVDFRVLQACVSLDSFVGCRPSSRSAACSAKPVLVTT